jgi:hypothetical protein
MKSIISLLIIFSLLFITGCGTSKTMNGNTYETYGLFNEAEVMRDHPDSKCVDYRISVGNVVWSILLFQTIVFPIYFVGFSLWEPVGMLPDCK